MQPQRVSNVKTCLGANWDTSVCVLRLTRGSAGRLHANATKACTYNHASWSLSEQRWCRPASKKLYCAPLHKQKLFKDWALCGREKLWSSKKQHWLVFYYIVFLQWPSAWKQLSSWAILALTSRSSLMSSICKKTRGREKKSLWSEK